MPMSASAAEPPVTKLSRPASVARGSAEEVTPCAAASDGRAMTSRLKTAKSRLIMRATLARGTGLRKPGRDNPSPLAGRPHRVRYFRETVAGGEAFETAGDAGGEAGAFVDHRRIDLHAAGAGAVAVPGRFGRDEH